MTKIIIDTIDSRTPTTEFKDPLTTNRTKQWLDKYGVIKTNSSTINSHATIPTGTNGISVGTITIADDKTVTVNGEWRII